MSEPVAGFPAPLGAPALAKPDTLAREDSVPPPEPTRLWLHILLFGLTLISMQATSMMLNEPSLPAGEALTRWGAYQALPLLLILLVHELGHYIAARLHGVPASPPYFVPFPILSPFGTMGAVITMSDRIRSRKALLDIGAAGPIAGMVVAVPVLCYGLTQSQIVEACTANCMQEGQSLLYWLIKWLVVGPIAPGQDVWLHPMAFAGWGGLFLTMLNLLPWGQLDGGHIAYALLGPKQDRIARWVRRGLLVVFAYNVATMVVPVLLHRSTQPLVGAVSGSLFWLFWYGITGWMAKQTGDEHPPFDPGKLGLARRAVAVSCLILFVVLFMPAPLVSY
ncbi:MAG TPA: site-2 protease family protein [Polyangiaceae bacterium]|nr:site-2 protease family protein [Polyangiaceae bacterium]